jgi:hypothetical protein
MRVEMVGIQAQASFVEAQGSLQLRARAHLLIADSHLRTTTPEHLPSVRDPVEHSLTRAIACCDAAEWWTQGEEVATLLALARHAWGDAEGCVLAADKAAAFAEAVAAGGQCIVL